MKIGVICEGPTDFVAIEAFFGHALGELGIKASFIDIQPKMDRSSPKGGWGKVLRWLDRNQIQKRRMKYFLSGPFENSTTKVLDCLLIHMDTDVLDKIEFQNCVQKNYPGINIKNPVPHEPAARSKEIEKVFLVAGWHQSNMSEDELRRHISLPAVESTEAWCLAAHSNVYEDFELVSGQDLKNRFMSALSLAEGQKPKTHYNKIDKNIERRKFFCEKYAHCSQNIIHGCTQFRNALTKINLSR